MSQDLNETEKVVEFMVDHVGAVTLAIRPCLKFLAEGYQLEGKDCISLFGSGRKIILDVPEEVRPALLEADQILLYEFRIDGEAPERELDLSRS